MQKKEKNDMALLTLWHFFLGGAESVNSAKSAMQKIAWQS